MQTYLAIIWTYLSISFTLFLIVMIKNENVNIDIQTDNRKWKEEIRLRFSLLEKKIEWDVFWKKAKIKSILLNNK